MITAGWIGMLVVLLCMLGFVLPFAIFFYDVFTGRRAFLIPIMSPLRRDLCRARKINGEQE